MSQSQALSPPAHRQLSKEEIRELEGQHGGWTADDLARYGVPFPPPRGWKKQIIRHGIPWRDERDSR